MNPLGGFLVAIIGYVCGVAGAVIGMLIADAYRSRSDWVVVGSGFLGMLVVYLVVGVPVILWLARAGIL
jgi:hypothetical protein